MSLMQRTAQRWKLYLFISAMGVGATVTLLQVFLGDLLEKDVITALVIGGMVLVIATFAWACTTIICPHCQEKLLWYSIVKVGLGTWFNWLTELEHCPACGSRDGTPPSPAKRGKGRTKK